MQNVESKIFEFAKQNGLDLVGFAPKARFEGVDARYNPFSIFPEGEAVIMLGRRICRGALRGIEEGTNFGDYEMFGKNSLEDNFLTAACYDMTRVIEDEGFEAVPIFPNPVEVVPMGVSVAEGKPAPNVHPDFDFAAVAAGLCETAYSGTLLSPEYGPRQRFHMIITDAPLTPTPLLENPVCDNCGECVKACPLGAISETEYEIIQNNGKQMKVAKINYDLCRKCKNGAFTNRFISKGKPDRLAAACNRACMIHLEEEKRISNTFENKFRQNPAWALDKDGEYAG